MEQLSTLPAPPYATDVKARGWKFVLDHERMLQSDTWAIAPPDIRPWLLLLWVTAWQQTPCGSLPSADELIAARIGMAIKQFAKWRSVLLRGWWLASDGRQYHAVIAEQVQAMLEVKRREAERKADYRRRREENESRPSLPEAVPALSHGTSLGFPPDSIVGDDTGTGTGTSKRERRRATRLPADWALTPELEAFCRAERPDLDPAKTAARFRDFWLGKAGKDGAKLDWPATWRNWVRVERLAVAHSWASAPSVLRPVLHADHDLRAEDTL